MRRKLDKPTEKVTLNLFAGDFGQIREWEPRMGASTIIREIVHAWVANQRIKRQEAAQEVLREAGE